MRVPHVLHAPSRVRSFADSASGRRGTVDCFEREGTSAVVSDFADEAELWKGKVERLVASSSTASEEDEVDEDDDVHEVVLSGLECADWEEQKDSDGCERGVYAKSSVIGDGAAD